MNTGKCPQCEKPLQFIQFEEIPMRSGGELFDTGVSLFCPYCHTILSTSLYVDKTADEILFNVKKILEEVEDFLFELQSVHSDVENLQSVPRGVAAKKPLIAPRKPQKKKRK